MYFRFHLVSAYIALGCLVFLQSNGVMANAWSCDIVVPPSQSLLDGHVQQIDAGSVVCLTEGERGPLRIWNVQGTENKPIIVTNQNGVVTTTPYEYSISVERSRFLRITGQPKEGSYGIRLGGTVGIGNLSEYIELDNLEVYRARFAGLMIKTDPSCLAETWPENFTMRGLRIHHNYIHDTETGEGMYVGYTGKSRTLMCDGVQTTVYPHKIRDIEIAHNRLEQIAADGIQLNSVEGDARIQANTIYRTGVSPFSEHFQNTGIQVGGNSVEVSDNIIYHSGGNGMMLDGDGLLISRNTIVGAGENGIFARNAAQQNASVSGGLPYRFEHNMIIRPVSYGIKLYAVRTASANVLSHNTIEDDGRVDAANRPMTYSYLNLEVARDEQNNHHYVVEY